MMVLLGGGAFSHERGTPVFVRGVGVSVKGWRLRTLSRSAPSARESEGKGSGR